MSEIVWRFHPVHKDYLISSKGDVIGKRKREHGHPKPDPQGYVRVTAGGMKKGVHRMVAETFIPNPNNYPMINHINGVRDDNRIINLEWCDAKHNYWHSKHNMRLPVMRFGLDHHICHPVAKYSLDGKLLAIYETKREATIKNGLKSASSITNQIKGRFETCCGARWVEISKDVYIRYKRLKQTRAAEV